MLGLVAYYYKNFCAYYLGCAPLAIGIISPTGQLVEELGYKLQKATIYQVNYKTKEKGDYVMHVTWGSEEVPGSPFIINSG